MIEKEVPITELISKLQNDVRDQNTLVSELLGQAIVISEKLGDHKARRWITNELWGYADTEDIPDYRKIRGNAVFWLRSRMLGDKCEPIPPDSPEYREVLKNQSLNWPIHDLEQFPKDRDVYIPSGKFIPTGGMSTAHTIARQPSFVIRGQPSLCVQYAEIAKIFDTVRTSLKEWTPAESVQVINASLHLPALKELIKELSAVTSELPPGSPERVKCEDELQTLNVEASSSEPKIPIVTELLKSVRTIFEGAAGNVLASDLVPKISAYIARFFS